ncbi:putative cell wall-binding protease [Lachnospiraceae bacterium TWA4]|nr:putative cell wall-binding protease [Lachnospiraceae bacterium TWA4]
MDDGVNRFGSGKLEENYQLIHDSGALLDELIDKYSGSYYYPTASSMTDDEHDKANESENPHGSKPDESQTSNDSNITEVSNMTDLMRIFHDAYDKTLEQIEFTTVGGFKVDIEDLQTVYTQLQREDPIDVSGVESWQTWNMGDKYHIIITYSYEIEELKKIKSETVQLVDDVVKKVATNGLSDYEIVNAVNEYLCDTVYYPNTKPYEPITHTAYGALKNGVAVCEGYACAAKLILNGCGVECDIEVGDCLNGGGHAWNLVKVDSQWYQLDVTWNDESYSRSDYLLVTDDYMKQSRTWDENNYPVTPKVPYTVS